MESRFPYTNPYESNPFPVQVPESIKVVSQDLYDFMAQLLSIHREQHNLVQAGDTPAPWQFLTRIGPKQLFTPGSLGTFVHPVHGMIHARYVKIVRPSIDLWPGAPIGWWKGRKDFQFEVTTAFSESTRLDLAGIGAYYRTPIPNEFGWAIVHGVNIQSIRYEGASPFVGEQLRWSDTNRVSEMAANSSLLGIVMNVKNVTNVSPNVWDLPPGSVRISVENH